MVHSLLQLFATSRTLYLRHSECCYYDRTPLTGIFMPSVTDPVCARSCKRVQCSASAVWVTRHVRSGLFHGLPWASVCQHVNDRVSCRVVDLARCPCLCLTIAKVRRFFGPPKHFEDFFGKNRGFLAFPRLSVLLPLLFCNVDFAI